MDPGSSQCTCIKVLSVYGMELIKDRPGRGSSVKGEAYGPDAGRLKRLKLERKVA